VAKGSVVADLTGSHGARGRCTADSAGSWSWCASSAAVR